MFEQLKSDWHGTSIPPNSCLRCCLWPITSTMISSLHPRKYHSILENLWSRWPTVSSPFTTLTAYLSMGLWNSRLATGFSPIDGFHTSWYTWYEKIFMLSTDDGLLHDMAQAFSNVFLANQRRVHSWASYYCRHKCETLDSVKFIVKIWEQTTNFFSLTRALLDFLIFSRNHAWKLGVRLIHKS